MTPAPVRFAAVQLSAPAQATLARLVAMHGPGGAATRLGCSPTTVEAMRDGGRVRAATVARVEAKLRSLT